VAIEVKASDRVHEGHLKPLRALCQEHKVRRALVVSLESEPRLLPDGIQILPWTLFIEQLWAGCFSTAC